MKPLVRAGIDGFLGSFRLAAALLLAIMSVMSAFVHGGADAAMKTARHIGEQN